MSETERQWGSRIRGSDHVRDACDSKDASRRDGVANGICDVVSRDVTYGPWLTDAERAAQESTDGGLTAEDIAADPVDTEYLVTIRAGKTPDYGRSDTTLAFQRPDGTWMCGGIYPMNAVRIERYIPGEGQ